MKECKYSKILPCYTDGYGVWHYLDDTHDKVYGVNKQMCDIGKTMNDPMKPLSEEAVQEIAKALEITKNPKGIIMEKKTKKMTKAEAFEYLKNRKVNTNGGYEEVLKKLFECGIEWNGGGRNIVDYGNYLIIDNDGHLFHCGCDMDGRYWRTHLNEEISVGDILSIEIVEEKKGDERKGEILDEIAKLGKKISDLIEEYDGDIIIEIDQYDVLLRNSGDILYRK